MLKTKKQPSSEKHENLYVMLFNKSLALND